MGQRGPKPKPVELKLLEGNRGHRPLRPEVSAPEVPRRMTREEIEAWECLSAELDRHALAMLRETIGRLHQVKRAIDAKAELLVGQGKDPTDALMDTTPNGLRVQSALYQILNKEQGKLDRMLESFWRRPDARARMTTAIREQLQLVEGGAGQAAPADAAEPRGFADFD